MERYKRLRNAAERSPKSRNEKELIWDTRFEIYAGHKLE
jgi:hypothetical protein